MKVGKGDFPPIQAKVMSNMATKTTTTLESRLGEYGKARLRFLREEKPAAYQEMYLDETLEDHLMEVQNRADEMHHDLRLKMTAQLDQSLKETDFLAYVGQANAVASQVREIVLAEVIYQ